MRRTNGKALKRLHQLSSKPKRVEVTWIDSSGEDGWSGAAGVLDDLDEGVDGLTCLSCGYLVDERDETVTIVGSYTVDQKTGLHNEYMSSVTIPRVAIVEIKELRR